MKAVIASVLLLASVAFIDSARAEPSTRVAWTPATLRLVKGGDAERGKSLAATCQSCHGAEGAADAPHLNGQLATYLYRQLRDYKDGSRSHAVMSALTAGLSDQDMADLGQFYSHEPPPAASPGMRATKVPPLVANGDSKRLIPPCGICHGGSGQGEVVDTPRLAGQKSAYLKQTLLAYRSGQRHNDIYRRMRMMSERLSEGEIDALTEYYAGLH
ncbi:MAG: c-type cytochrome [Methylotetracoccus sp.]